MIGVSPESSDLLGGGGVGEGWGSQASDIGTEGVAGNVKTIPERGAGTHKGVNKQGGSGSTPRALPPFCFLRRSQV